MSLSSSSPTNNTSQHTHTTTNSSHKPETTIKNLGAVLRHFFGLELSIECKNGKIYRGVLQDADDHMNLVLETTNSLHGNTRHDNKISDSSQSVPTCDEINFRMIHIRGSNIRYVHFPDNADLPKLVRLGLDRIKAAKNKYSRGIRKNRSALT